MAVCSADTILRGVKELSCESTQVINPKSKVVHQFNINTPLNALMIKALRLTGQLNKHIPYDLDYDPEASGPPKSGMGPAPIKNAMGISQGLHPLTICRSSLKAEMETARPNTPSRLP